MVATRRTLLYGMALAGALASQLQTANAAGTGASTSIRPVSTRLSSGLGDLRLHVERMGKSTTHPPIVFVHGATFPSSLSVNWRLADGRSWRDILVAAGHEVWTFDFLGFGDSDRYPAMAVPPIPGPLGRSDAAAAQLGRIVDHVLSQGRAQHVVLLAHSWGTMVAGRFAADRPEAVDRLIFFGPILQREMKGLPNPDTLPAWTPMPLSAQWKRFIEDVPADQLGMERAEFDRWGVAYLATDPASGVRQPAAVAIPAGPQADIAAAWQGRLAYDPSRIAAPITVLRGEWDTLSTDADLAWLRSTIKGRLDDRRLGHGAHLMQLEPSRERLWTACLEALEWGAQPPA